MRLVVISIVKNESDVIEAFVRHHRALCDAMVFVDNGSTDATRQILDRLATELGGITVRSDPAQDYPQEEHMSSLAAGIGQRGLADFVLPLDADEFIRGTRADLERALSTLPPRTPGILRWVTHVPTPSDDWSEPNVLRRIVHRRTHEPTQLVKVAVPQALCADPRFALEPGNHGAMIDAESIPGRVLAGLTLAHFPVRSVEHLAAKMLIGQWAVSGKARRRADHCHHWRIHARRLERDPRVSLEDLQSLASSYLDEGPVPVERDPFPAALVPEIRWPELTRVDVLQRVAAFAGQHFQQYERSPYQHGGMAVARTYFGALAYHQNDQVVGRSLKHYGEWADSELQLLLRLVAPGDHVIDVGAGVGARAVPLAMHVGPQGSVHAFEPRRLVHQLLCANAALNSVGNLTAHQAAVADKAGQAFAPPPAEVLASPPAGFRIGERRAGEATPVITLDGRTWPRIKLLRVSAAGDEPRVLRGAAKLLERDRPVLQLSASDEVSRPVLVRELANRGYRAYWLPVPRFNPHNYYRNVEDAFAGQPHDLRFLAVHRSVPVTQNMLAEVTGPDDTPEAAAVRAEALVQTAIAKQA